MWKNAFHILQRLLQRRYKRQTNNDWTFVTGYTAEMQLRSYEKFELIRPAIYGRRCLGVRTEKLLWKSAPSADTIRESLCIWSLRTISQALQLPRRYPWLRGGIINFDYPTFFFSGVGVAGFEKRYTVCNWVWFDLIETSLSARTFR